MCDILNYLFKIIEKRKKKYSNKSYVSLFFKECDDLILKKIMEEASEVILAAKDSKFSLNKKNLVKEVADLWFHSLILLSKFDLSLDNLLLELISRKNISGFDEKKSRYY